MMFPSIFNDNFFDDFMDDPWESRFFRAPIARSSAMKTDVKDSGDHYDIAIELPGFKKDEIQAELKNGYLTITASKNENNDEKDEKGNYLRRERYHGSCSRSFFVGEDVTQEDIHAKFENGILSLSIPKADAKKVEEKKVISIEG
ncbi:MAG: Hsp20/alpha crystallin family protein [Bilifractor sp.]|jgi:HSP20 family protein